MELRGPLLLLWLLVLLVMIEVATAEEPGPRLLRRLEPDVDEHRTALSNASDNDTFREQPTKTAAQKGRTFGHKRIQFMLMPMIYKMGVMMTMIAILTVISLKGLMIGVTLLVLKLSTIFGKFFAGWQSHSSGSWTSPHQPIHLHLHQIGPYETHGQAYGGWETAGGGPHESYYYKG